MQFGVQVPHFRQVASPEAIDQVCQAAEALGYDHLWVTDHVVMPDVAVSRFSAMIYEPVTTLPYVAARTTRIRLGTSALILPYRNPVLVAKALATIDNLSRGRLIVGAAVGWLEPEFEALGVPFHDRGARSDEYLKLLKVLWTEERPTFQGRFYQMSNVAFAPRPVQKPHPPLWIGGSSRPALRRAATFGDGWHPTRPSPEDVALGLAEIRRLASQRGRTLDGFAVLVRQPLCILDAPGTSPRPLIGTPDRILASIEQYRQAGVTGFMMDLFYSVPEIEHQDVPAVLQMMERFAREIRPYVGG